MRALLLGSILLPLGAQSPPIALPTQTPTPLWNDKSAPGAPFPQQPPAQSLPAPVPAPAAPAKSWTNKAALGFVAVGGNAQSQSLGFSNEFKVVRGRTGLQANVAGVRVNTTAVTRSASGTSLGDAVVTETRSTRTTTESYSALLRLDQKITETFFWFGAGSWDRNRPAGLESRTKAVAGLGDLWISDGTTRFRTDYGLGYTKEEPVFRTPGYPEHFATWQLGARLERKMLPTSAFTSELAVSGNLREGPDWNGVLKNALTAAISTRLAVKVGYDLSYRNLPNTVGVDVVQTPPSDPPVVLGQVPFRLKRLDTVFSTSLVLTF